MISAMEARKRFEAVLADPRRWNLRVAADFYIAAFLAPKTGGVPANRNTVTIPTTAHIWDALAGRSLYGPLGDRAQDFASAASTFHWPLVFPDVMAAGGFDVVLGNPPWERIKLQEQEFFVAREPSIAQAPNSAARGKLIAKLKGTAPGTRERALFEEFERAKRTAEASSVFARVAAEDGGRFPFTGRGDINTYALFTELFAGLTSKRGRAGVVVPTGIATNETTSAFFGSIVAQKRLVTLQAFDEIKNWFAGTKDNQSFCILVLANRSDEPTFVFQITNTGELKDDRRIFQLTPEEILLLNPNTKTAPVFRSRADAELTTKIYARVPVLVDETKGNDGNQCGVSFMRMFDMANDSSLFRTAAQLREAGFVRDGNDWTAPQGLAPNQGALMLSGGTDHQTLALNSSLPGRDHKRYVPLYEAKMVHQFDHRFGYYPDGHVDDTRALPRPSLLDKSNPKYEVMPRYWIPLIEVEERLATKNWKNKWLMGWRDITNSTNEHTIICGVSRIVGFGDKFLLMFPAYPKHAIALIGALNSLTLDYCARQKLVGTSFKYFLMKQLPVLPPSAFSPNDFAFIQRRVLELTYTSHSMASFAGDFGYDGAPFAWDEDRRAQLRAELDAWYARAYGLKRDELRYILDPTDVKGLDYPSETFRVLKKNDIAHFGEYRTARLVLAAWDALERGELTS